MTLQHTETEKKATCCFIRQQTTFNQIPGSVNCDSSRCNSTGSRFALQRVKSTLPILEFTRGHREVAEVYDKDLTLEFATLII